MVIKQQSAVFLNIWGTNKVSHMTVPVTACYKFPEIGTRRGNTYGAGRLPEWRTWSCELGTKISTVCKSTGTTELHQDSYKDVQKFFLKCSAIVTNICLPGNYLRPRITERTRRSSICIHRGPKIVLLPQAGLNNLIIYRALSQVLKKVLPQ